MKFTPLRLLAIGIALPVIAYAYYHLTKDLETYGITEAFTRPISEKIPEGLESLKAEDCGVCHEEIYKEWKTTIHSKAWTEDYFQTDWAYDKKKQNCLNCHTPMANQQPNLVTGFKGGNLWSPILKPNPDFDPAFRDEGVTCAACHVRNGKIAGPHKIKDAPHPTVYDPTMRNGMGVCVRCHVTNATEEFSVANPNICSTMQEIEAKQIKPNCINCHMPAIKRPLMAGFPKRKGRQHLWRGGHNPEMVSKDLAIGIEKKSQNGNRYTYEISLTNIGTHHKLPTGTPDRNIVVTMSLLDENRDVLTSKQYKIIRRIVWRPIIFELSDNRLAFQAPQKTTFSFNIHKPKSPRYLRVKADYFFLEEWRRKQLNLADNSHKTYTMAEKTIRVP